MGSKFQECQKSVKEVSTTVKCRLKMCYLQDD